MRTEERRTNPMAQAAQAQAEAQRALLEQLPGARHARTLDAAQVGRPVLYIRRASARSKARRSLVAPGQHLRPTGS